LAKKVEKAGKIPYENRDDLEKIASQWKKLTALHDRRDYSAAITRCSTAAEIAANLAIRREFDAVSDLLPAQVNSFLRDANGLNGKVRRLLLVLRFKNNAKDLPTAT
jgi:hypothetical protein